MSEGKDKIFISYRRQASQYFANSMFLWLSNKGFDAFYDYASINSGEWERIILNQIKARGHFLAVLAPATLERLENPDDMLRREMERALELKRNVVPVLHGGFEFGVHGKRLPENLQRLADFNALRFHDDYFEEGMQRLVDRFLQQPVYGDVEAAPPEEHKQVEADIAGRKQAQQPKKQDRSAEEYFNLANEAAYQDEMQRALELYSLAIKNKPDYAAAYINRGVVYSRLGKDSLAMSDFNQVITLQPGNLDAYKGRAKCYFRLGKKDAYEAEMEIIARMESGDKGSPAKTSPTPESGASPKSETDLSSMFEDIFGASFTTGEQRRSQQGVSAQKTTASPPKTPSSAEDYYNLGSSAVDRGDRKSAIRYFTQAIERNPDYAWAYCNRGASYAKLGQHQRAIKDFDRAIALNPDFATSFSNRGHCYGELGKHQRAIKDYDRAIDLDPNSSEAYYGRGTIKTITGQHQSAIQDFDRAIALDPNFAMAYSNRGHSYSLLGQYQRSIQDYSRAVKLDPNFVTAFNNRGLVYEKLGDLEKARADFERVLKLDPNRETAKKYLADLGKKWWQKLF